MQERDKAELLGILEELKLDHRLSPKDVLKHFSTGKVMVPVSLFSDRKLGMMETVVKYLKENQGFSLSEIARMLGRDPRTVWVMYHKASIKLPEGLTFIPGISVPLSVFVKGHGPLKSVVTHLRHTSGMTFREIGSLLGRDTAMVCTVYNRK